MMLNKINKIFKLKVFNNINVGRINMFYVFLNLSHVINREQYK